MTAPRQRRVEIVQLHNPGDPSGAFYFRAENALGQLTWVRNETGERDCVSYFELASMRPDEVKQRLLAIGDALQHSYGAAHG